MKTLIKKDGDQSETQSVEPTQQQQTETQTRLLGVNSQQKQTETQTRSSDVNSQQQQIKTLARLSDLNSHEQTNRGGSQDETLPQQPVSSSLASLCRKRPGSGTSPLTSAKRKQQVLHETYPSDSPQHEEVPLLNLGRSGQSLSLDEVEVRVQEDVASVAAVLRVREDVVESLLYQSSWKKDVVIQVSMSDQQPP